METNIVIGILSGSVGTIIISKIFEYFSEKATFKRELKRQFFAKKLEAAEKATRFCVSGIDAYNMLQMSLDMLINDGDAFTVDKLFHEAVSKCRLLWDTSNDQINMIGLYFDLEATAWCPSDNESNMANCFSELLQNDISIEEKRRIAKELIKCVDFEKRRLSCHANGIRNKFKCYDI